MSNETLDYRPQDSGSDEVPSVVVNGEDCNSNATSSNSSVAKGLSSLISSTITDFDSTAEATSRSQEQLAFSLDRLTGELDKLLEDAPSPFIMQHAARISGVRRRVTALNSVLKSIQRRIDNMDRMMSAGSLQGMILSSSAHLQI
ncbi:uncharacterized protein LOC111402381 [Olea europaea subsp. europaea]|uniref:Biogenesis of lysosome-related organelles complex 1 subunit 7 n=1 Tax=Olea europaea subsp. europaea TaxID=158383 RepID=A0A8S0RRB2_OLEEU|nr:uncharacterized protein LOC111402381 [Olea europaea subsp. europaea]